MVPVIRRDNQGHMDRSVASMSIMPCRGGDGMMFDELKTLLREWYEAEKSVNLGSMVVVDAYADANYRLKEYDWTLYEGGKATE